MAEAGPGGAGGGGGEQSCIFCHIISGRVQSKKVYEDPECVAILDINPANPGHVLILPKKHYAIMPQMDELIIGHILMVAKAMSGALLKALKVEGTNIFIANGAVAGQKAPHFMVHVIPRKEGDGLNLTLAEYRVDPAELSKVHDMLLQRIKANLSVTDIDIEKMKARARLASAGHGAPGAAALPAQQKKETPPAKEQVADSGKMDGRTKEDEDFDLDAITTILRPVKSHGAHHNAASPASQASHDIHDNTEKPGHEGAYSESRESRNSQMLARDEANLHELKAREEMEKQREKAAEKRKKITLADIDGLFRGGGR